VTKTVSGEKLFFRQEVQVLLNYESITSVFVIYQKLNIRYICTSTSFCLLMVGEHFAIADFEKILTLSLTRSKH